MCPVTPVANASLDSRIEILIKSGMVPKKSESQGKPLLSESALMMMMMNLFLTVLVFQFLDE